MLTNTDIFKENLLQFQQVHFLNLKSNKASTPQRASSSENFLIFDLSKNRMMSDQLQYLLNLTKNKIKMDYFINKPIFILYCMKRYESKLRLFSLSVA